MLDKSQLSGKISSIDQQAEIAKFDALAQEWRDPNGKFKHVLRFNQTRLTAIENAIAIHFKRDLTQDIPFEGLKILDIGCGVGLLCEPLASQGAAVTGIDASAHNITMATQHAKAWSIKVDYKHCLASDLVDIETQYDVILNTEVIEHIEDKQQLIDICCEKLKPQGLLIMATLNRTFASYLIAIIGAEYVMQYLPKGTHDWQHFVKPEELDKMIATRGLATITTEGMTFNPLTTKWKIGNNTRVNYLLYAYKPKSTT
ncbi:bifunctional 2-polyprenyl-6-hydroxyphenol methylase/3-demethylubiquinol 3-O-methyltransferase UbiG [Shewanella sp. Isolate11]|uniref:bifunctional 2-polyprenyl-6-hydroxyphenol methylase/3-demethylubiquinol 3-O-methyltransferase UbiG n=1 Tax=Shewanella sp. Isolate11 TaxID=2908530 RepID=UPI001EFD5CF3|nr:bifunctional 2-polyprenyl-6-hydroxyphenol methylase/3-demethylubiquinol 3-O-methyltransferase UbiG [Shewanella sp. Isolate11]MCG9698135.1 bifunctional 2-polyprenyl-6-hydroxyphenol methylase/3-demethylubiquinol 3-O-methyltransferase UbiG [Shewanella sp. Isolate11]